MAPSSSNAHQQACPRKWFRKCWSVFYGRGPQAVGHGPLVGCEGITIGLWKQPASVRMRMRILTCASSEWAHARVIYLHEQQACVYATHANGVVCVRAYQPLLWNHPFLPPAGPQSWKCWGNSVSVRRWRSSEKLESLGHLTCQVLSLLRFSSQRFIPSSAATFY